MGYTTDFKGSLSFDKPLTPAQVAYIQAFSSTRRMHRNAEIADTLEDELRLAVGLLIGEHGAYYVGSHSDGQSGQKDDKSVIDHNKAPGDLSYDGKDWNKYYEHRLQMIKDGLCQPGLWCNWTVSDNGKKLQWDGGEKFYNYIEWLQYIITHFFAPWNIN